MGKNKKLKSSLFLWISAAPPRARHWKTWNMRGGAPTVRSRQAVVKRVQAACKPGSVPGPGAGGWPFLWDPCRHGPRATDPDDRLGNEPAPTLSRMAAPSSLLGLAPGGVYRAADVAADAVRSGRTLSPLPAGRPQPAPAGGLLSVALSLGSPPPGVTRHRVPVEPGLSSPAYAAGAAIRPPAPGFYLILVLPARKPATSSTRPMVASSSTPSQQAGRQRRWKARHSMAGGTPCAAPG
jgi:hypothetical protein